MCYEGVSGILLVFDVTDESSLQNLNQYWLPKILDNADENIELAIIGNKTDLMNERVLSPEDVRHFIDTNQYLKDNTRISSPQKQKYASCIIGNTNYYEISAT